MFSALEEAVLFTFVDMHEEALDAPRSPSEEGIDLTALGNLNLDS